ncbi:(-)-germacrene D synthase-like isoform X2 [Juglans microcarpa x Juglans regia]|uniref:(-)-germacrene D synthase-like isoform X2 n=2 Tax=Juglans microcarpa x Juglans regia TaxID=2249226 RepID=UPI001B7DB95C|nr:(-)-germacrene D synthase-like isoform X2 [Juglans microcarpa x Juglans regia]
MQLTSKMSVQISAVAAPTAQNRVMPEINCRSANFQPSIWGDHFLSYAYEFLETDVKMRQQIEELKENVRTMLMATVEKPSQKLNLVDAIQRLGVSYHFGNEIQAILQQLQKTHESDDHEYNDDLYTVALLFRLLRQDGHCNASADMFNKFKDRKGNFKGSLRNDVKGILSLYEATHLRVKGEDILDEALVFTTTHLESVAAQLSGPLAAQVTHALKQPIRKGLQRLEARHYFSVYQEDASHDKVLNFAKLDFNLLQKVHQKELSDIARWWKDLDFPRKLPFIRDRVVECYFWILGVYFEPQYCFARRMLTKVISMTSVIDDIYDVYGTIEELDLFTEAIERWDMSVVDKLPEYMKMSYQALLDVYTEMEQNLGEEKSYHVHYAIEAMKNQVRAYHHEAKWFHQKYIPTMDEYMPLALVTSAYEMLATTSLVGMGEIVTKDSFEWLFSDPKMVTASAVVCRLMDDIVSHKFEQKRGHVASAVECYMTQHGVTEEEAVHELSKQVTDAWKDINKECLYPTEVPMPILMRVLNLARVIDVVYKDEDGYTHAGIVLKDFVASLMVDPLPL